MEDFAIFDREEQKVLTHSIWRALYKINPESYQTWDSDDTVPVITRLIGIVNGRYVSHSLALEIEQRRPIILNILWKEVRVDRWCDISNGQEFRSKLLEIIWETCWLLGVEIPWFDEIAQRKLEYNTNSFLKLIDNRFKATWVNEMAEQWREQRIYLSTEMIWDEKFKDMLKYIFRVHKWQCWEDHWEGQHWINVLTEYSKHLLRENLQLNPYSCSGNFKFPYESIDEVFGEFCFSEEKIAKLRSEVHMFKYTNEYLSQKDMIWIMLIYPESDWNLVWIQFSDAKKMKSEKNISDQTFETIINNQVVTSSYYTDILQINKVIIKKISEISFWKYLSSGIHNWERPYSKCDDFIPDDDSLDAIWDKELIDIVSEYFWEDLYFTKDYSEKFGDLSKYIDLSIIRQRRKNFKNNSETSLTIYDGEELRILDNLKAEINNVNNEFPWSLKINWIPESAEEILWLLRTSYWDNVFNEVNTFIEQLIRFKESLLKCQNKDYFNLKSDETKILLRKIYPNNEYVLWQDLWFAENNIKRYKVFENLISISPNFLKENNFPEDRESLMKALMHHWINYWEKLKIASRALESIESSLKNLNREKESPKSKYIQYIQQDLEDWIERIKWVLTK